MYSAEISRSNPSCILFIIDQSGSMSDPFGASTKSESVSDAINRLLQNLVIKCAKSEGIRDYYHVGVIGYGAGVGPAFGGVLAGKEMVPISEIADNPSKLDKRLKKVPDGASGLVDQLVKFPVWFEPVANGGTPMCEAMRTAHAVLTQWIGEYTQCFPPVVIHITDGESTDGDPTVEMEQLRALSTDDGNVLLFNLHISDSPSAVELRFPETADALPDTYSRVLYEGSSPLTQFMIQVANQEYDLNLSDGARGFVLNADLTLVIQALDIGTRPANLR
ncbi:von Willebrand factor type A domain-containing protein [Paenibacillus taihuensis]|uniref:von Willebrand factor type A domain-containing protein n=1 Tax=Paenibacillus taihuensis TaxID=1156355 RepID=A0A3D9Q362_9BACL|nr:vWA domain-containing protein [Paenibacillus taihuensis]REE55428.1 von Willebrand factor type A domain-containing protein [Paenibacillus taihuensis]